jgi:hypothetical protein
MLSGHVLINELDTTHLRLGHVLSFSSIFLVVMSLPVVLVVCISSSLPVVPLRLSFLFICRFNFFLGSSAATVSLSVFYSPFFGHGQAFLPAHALHLGRVSCNCNRTLQFSCS